MPGQPDGPPDEPPHDRNAPTRRLDRRGIVVSSTAMDAATANPRIATQPPASPERQERTQLAGTGRSSATADTTDNPVVGWLVVMAGPGRGQARAIGYGMNAIGRGADQRISLDFGDEQISRSNHAALTYDPRSRKFFVQHGGGANLTYLDGQAVLAPAPIESGSDIIIGRTTLRFVALCGPQFDWQDE